MRLISAKRSGTLEREYRSFERIDLLLIDELGYIPFEREATDLLFQLVSQRYERRSIALTTNLPFEKWTQVFPDEMTATFQPASRHPNAADEPAVPVPTTTRSNDFMRLRRADMSGRDTIMRAEHRMSSATERASLPESPRMAQLHAARSSRTQEARNGAEKHGHGSSPGAMRLHAARCSAFAFTRARPHSTIVRMRGSETP